jgi:hypothetical protein
MKAINSLCTWRPLVGAAVVGALAIAVSVQGSPRVGGERDKGPGKSQASRVVTGPSAHINSAIAQGPGATITLQPVSAVSGPGYAIAGQTMTMGALPARVWFEFQLTGFGVNTLKTFQCSVDSFGVEAGTSGYDGDQATCSGAENGVGSGVSDIVPAVEACVDNAGCDVAYLGAACPSGGSICTGGFCEDAFENKCDPQWMYGLKGGIYSCNNAPGNLNWGCGGTTLGDADFAVDFAPGYGGTLVLNVPAGAKGLYTIGWDPIGTFISDFSGSPIVLGFVPGQVEVPCGRCCFGLGGASPGCDGGLSTVECAGRPAVSVFGKDELCPADGGSDCPSCTRDADCAELPTDDLCTQNVCDEASGVCSNPKIAAWTAGTCCVAGVVTTPNCPDQCETAACSSPPDRGSAVCNPRTGLGCDDGSACTYNDTCADGAGSCDGTSVVEQECSDDTQCLLGGAQFPCSDGFCFCTETPDLSVEIDPGGKSLTPYTPIFDVNCFESGDQGDKITGRLVVGPFGGDITGGQFQVTWDPTCVEYVSIGAGPGLDVVYGPVESTPGTIFMAVGVPFGAGPNSIPGGGAVLAVFSFIKIGDCNSCEICVDGSNPQNAYLADAVGQRINVAPGCSKPIKANNTVKLTVPGNITTNADCNVPTAVETWPAPSATDSCGTSVVHCRGEHESGVPLDRATAEGGGEFPLGASSFCCYAVSDYCGKIVGCPPDTNCLDGNDLDTKSDGCWTVRVNDGLSLDITIGLSPGSQSRPGDNLTRCIKFTLYDDCLLTEPLVYSDDVTFGGLYEFIGKSTGKIKIPNANNNWGCITAQDQLHTLRSCYSFDASDCIGGQLNASFYGDPRLGGNWLIGGNLDGWKKDDPTANPSLDVIDILDYGTFVSQFLTDYCDDPLYTACPNTPCGTNGPNADINGDGKVDMDDYAFVSMNFLTSSKQCCCGPEGGAAGVNAITEISVAQLRALGLGDLVVADLNGDGLLNLADMAAFDQGVRPTKSTPTKGGTRSSGSR